MSFIPDQYRRPLEAMRKAADKYIEKIVDSPAEINWIILAIRKWKPGKYNSGDVRIYENIPYKCVQSHDSTSNESWSPAETPALWMQYHGTEKQYARPWVAPTGAHDMYKKDEYMIWTDGSIYRCIVDTIYSPTDYALAWEKSE